MLCSLCVCVFLQPDFYKTFIQDKHKILILVSFTGFFSLLAASRSSSKFDYNVPFSHLNIFRMSFTYLDYKAAAAAAPTAVGHILYGC